MLVSKSARRALSLVKDPELRRALKTEIETAYVAGKQSNK